MAEKLNDRVCAQVGRGSGRHIEQRIDLHEIKAGNVQSSCNHFQSATVEFVVSGDTVKIADIVVDASGREERRLNTIHVDGREHASGDGSGYSVLATWRGSHVLETVAKKDGLVVGRGMYEVSSDANTLIVSGEETLIVFDRFS